jgi:hypothetical protein
MPAAWTTGPDATPSAAPASRFCMACNYNLHGLIDHRCPECGRPFDPNDLASFTIRPLTPVARLVLRTRNWCVLLFVAAAFVCWLASYCTPGRWSACCAACTWIWLSLPIWIFGQLGLFHLFAKHYFRVGSPRFNRRPLIFAAASLIVLLVLNWTNLPGRLVFWFSRPALDQAARSTYASRGVCLPGWIGLYSIDRVHFEDVELQRARKRGGGTFKVRAVCFDGNGGATSDEDTWLVYCPDGDLRDLPRDFRDLFTALGDGWYEWHAGWASCPLVQ